MPKYNCDQCDKTYLREYNLNRHVDQVHGEDDEDDMEEDNQEDKGEEVWLLSNKFIVSRFIF